MGEFINPYNFIPMGEKKSRAADSQGQKLVSGMIEYSLLTKTPVFIPNTSYEHFYGGPEEHRSYPFYSYVDYSVEENRKEIPNPEPVIPGSEIRGMFRSNYEILTNSCMSALDSDMQLSKRTMESYSAGLLHRVEQGGTVCYDLYEAEYDALWRTMGANDTRTDLHWERDEDHSQRQCYIQDKFSEGDRVDCKLRTRKAKGREFKPLAYDVRSYTGATKQKEGYIIKGEKGPRKHCCHIFTLPQPGKKPIQSDVKISLLDDVLKVYNINSRGDAGPYKEYKEQFDKFKQGEGNQYFPVYFSKIKNKENNKEKVFLSPACKTREIYDNTLQKLAGKLAPCTGKSGFCESCELFGTVTKEGDSKSSRIRFTDLHVEKRQSPENYYVKKAITLPELSSPKLNNMEFYLMRPGMKDGNGAWFWTYDYYIDASGDIHIEQGRLAGRKFYWHQPLDDRYTTKEKKEKRNCTIKPLRTGNIFHGRLYFDKITEETLDKLIYLINAGEDSRNIQDKKSGYKIGMAKPLGFGSIACQVDKVVIKTYEIREGAVECLKKDYEGYEYQRVHAALKEQAGEELLHHFQIMTGFDSVSLQKNEYFSYPKLNKYSKGYEWFVNNHKGVKGKDRNQEIKMPNSRKEMVFDKYLEAMEPRVKKVERKKR